MAKVVRLVTRSLEAGQIIGLTQGLFVLSSGAGICSPAGRVSQSPGPELEHAVLFSLIFRGNNGPLGFHGCQLRDILTLSSTLAAQITGNVDMARMR
jgi:hypothetical protein